MLHVIFLGNVYCVYDVVRVEKFHAPVTLCVFVDSLVLRVQHLIRVAAKWMLAACELV